MNQKLISLLIIIFLFLLVSQSSFFVVEETDQYILTRFGKPVRDPISKAGLHFKIPLIEKAVRLDKRILQWDGYPNQIPTLDKKYIIVDSTARWRISDPLKFIQSVKTEQQAQTRLDDIIDSATRQAISKHRLVESVRNSNQILTQRNHERDAEENELYEDRLSLEKISVGRDKIQQMILAQASPTIREYGIELIDVRIKRLNYEASVEQKVFDRMISERKRIAEKLRSEGYGKKAEIDGQMKKELNRIESEAYRSSQEIKGAAQAEATSIYAEAYSKNPEFFEFEKSMQTYINSLKEKTVLFLSPESEFLRFLK